MASTLGSNNYLLRGEHHVPIYYEDTDLSGFVYHANYLKYFERAREHLIGVNYLKSLWEEGIHFVVAESNLRYLRPLNHGDNLVIKTDIGFSRSPILSCSQQGFRLETNGETSIVRASITVATLNRLNRPIRLPQYVVDHFLVHPQCIPNEENNHGR